MEAVSLQQAINKGANAEYAEHVRPEIAEYFRGLKSSTLELHANLTSASKAVVESIFKPICPVLWVAPPRVEVRPHPELAVIRDGIRQLFDVLEKRTKNLKTLYIGAAYSEIAPRLGMTQAHFSIHGKEPKDDNRIYVAMADRVCKLVADAKKTFPELNTWDIGFDCNAEELMDLFVKCEGVTGRVGLNLERSGRKYARLIYRDSWYNKGRRGIYDDFEATGASTALAYGMLPPELLGMACPDSTLYNLAFSGQMARMTDVRGYANGYMHDRATWADLLKSPGYSGEKFSLVFEIVTRIGPFFIMEISKTLNAGPVTRDLTLLSEPYVKVVNIFSYASEAKNLADLMLKRKSSRSEYFLLKREEYDLVHSYVASLDDKACTDVAIVASIRKRSGGAALIDKVFTKKWDLEDKHYMVLAMVVLLKVELARKTSRAAMKGLFTEGFLATQWRMLLETVGVPKWFAEWIEASDDALIDSLVSDYDPVLAQTEMLAERTKAEHAGNKFRIEVTRANDDDLSLRKSEVCNMCQAHPTYAEDCKDNLQVMKCGADQFEHTYELRQHELDNFREKLTPNDEDAGGLKAVKEAAKAATPKAAFRKTAMTRVLIGGFGTGKSDFIKRIVTEKDVVIAPFKKLLKDYKVDSEGNEIYFKTMHRAVSDARSCERMFIDEVGSLPYEYIATCVYLYQPKVVYLIGDMKQTKTMAEEGICVDKRVSFQGAHYLHKNFRNPVQVIDWAVEKYGYDMVPAGGEFNSDVDAFTIFEDGNAPPGIDFDDMPTISPDRALVNIEVSENTIRQYQGQTVENLRILVTAENLGSMTVPCIKLVGGTRARGTTYFQCTDSTSMDSLKAILDRVEFRKEIPKRARESKRRRDARVFLAIRGYLEDLERGLILAAARKAMMAELKAEHEDEKKRDDFRRAAMLEKDEELVSEYAESEVGGDDGSEGSKDAELCRFCFSDVDVVDGVCRECADAGVTEIDDDDEDDDDDDDADDGKDQLPGEDAGTRDDEMHVDDVEPEGSEDFVRGVCLGCKRLRRVDDSGLCYDCYLDVEEMLAPSIAPEDDEDDDEEEDFGVGAAALVPLPDVDDSVVDECDAFEAAMAVAAERVADVAAVVHVEPVVEEGPEQNAQEGPEPGLTMPGGLEIVGVDDGDGGGGLEISWSRVRVWFPWFLVCLGWFFPAVSRLVAVLGFGASVWRYWLKVWTVLQWLGFTFLDGKDNFGLVTEHGSGFSKAPEVSQTQETALPALQVCGGRYVGTMHVGVDSSLGCVADPFVIIGPATLHAGDLTTKDTHQAWIDKTAAYVVQSLHSERVVEPMAPTIPGPVFRSTCDAFRDLKDLDDNSVFDAEPINSIVKMPTKNEFTAKITGNVLEYVNRHGNAKKAPKIWRSGTGSNLHYDGSDKAQQLCTLATRYAVPRKDANIDDEGRRLAQRIAQNGFDTMIDTERLKTSMDDMRCSQIYQEWLGKARKAGYSQAHCLQAEFEDRIVRFQGKGIVKPKEDLIGWDKVFKAPQGISAWSKGANSFFGAACRMVSDAIRRSLKDEFVWNNGMSIDEAARRFCKASLAVPTAHNIRLDAEEMDAKQNEFTHDINKQFDLLMGFDSDFLDLYYSMYAEYTLLAEDAKVTLRWVKPSGAPWTLKGNSMLMALLALWLVQGDGPMAFFFQGDDVDRNQANMSFRRDRLAQLALYCPFVMTVEEGENAAFCGFILAYNTLVPNIRRKANKVIGAVYREAQKVIRTTQKGPNPGKATISFVDSVQKFQEAQVSMRDWCRSIRDAPGFSDIIRLNAETYSVSEDEATRWFEMVDSVSHISEAQFRSVADKLPMHYDYLSQGLDGSHDIISSVH